MKKEKEEAWLKNAGKAIEHFRKLKKISVVALSKKTNISYTDLANILLAEKTPTKEQIELICKEINIPKETIFLYSIDKNDVAKEKREAFEMLSPLIKNIIDDVTKETKPKKK